MNLASHLAHGLTHARNYTELLIADFDAIELWGRTVPGSQNHALWIVGHLTMVDNGLMGYINPDLKQDLGDFSTRYGKGSTPSTQSPTSEQVASVLEGFRFQRQRILGILETLSADDLAQPTIETAPPFLPMAASVFQILAWHEGLHSGQLSQIHRSLGKKALR